MRTRRDFLYQTFLASASLLLPSRAEASGFRLPDISVYTEQGEKTKLSAHYGSPLLLNTWARYCGPCIEEIPLLNELNSTIPILGLYFMESDLLSRESTLLQKVQASHPMTYRNVLVPLDGITELNDSYVEQTSESYIALPTFLLLDSLGQCIHTQEGSLNSGNNYSSLLRRIKDVE